MVKAKKFVLEKPFNGFPKASDLKLVEEELRPIKNGEFLTEAVFLSVDPYMRSLAHDVAIGQTFIGSQVAKIIESKNPKYPVGKYVVGEFGWRTHTIADETPPLPKGYPIPWIIPDLEGLPLSLSLVILGMPGNTAYFGFLEICKPQPGETVVVTGAAGAVGSIVGQIAKIKGCRVIGVAGSDDKGKWLTQELKFDHYVNYKDKDFEKKLAEAAPDGIDCYFDNVGGDLANKIMRQMNLFGRVSVCGVSSAYNNKDGAKADVVQFAVLFKQLKVEGFIFTRWLDRWFEGVLQNKQWIKEGKLVYRESVRQGFENMFDVFVEVLKGDNVGKAIVKV
ncbi:prostaglandin reductase 1-like [Zophobas morio]|uniref:prostaglandin reductase 1-like n=1 Tax=Zophobas morio TaxID=2755281 RepID=UPI0030838A00